MGYFSVALVTGASAATIALFAERDAPKYLRCDNGPKFVARSLAIWLKVQGTESRFVKPGALWQNAKVESFNGRLRAECLDTEVFHDLADAQLKIGLYRKFHNEERAHSSLGHMTPCQFRDHYQQKKETEKLYS